MNASIIPSNIVEKIILMAMQLKNKPVCDEIKQIKTLLTKSIDFFGKTFGTFSSEQLKITYEIIIEDAPDPSDFESETEYEKCHNEWKIQHKHNMFWKAWPRSSIKYLLK